MTVLEICHGQIECLAKMHAACPHGFASAALSHTTNTMVLLSGPVFGHDGWHPEERPPTSTNAYIIAACIGAVQLVDRQVLLEQFATTSLIRNVV